MDFTRGLGVRTATLRGVFTPADPVLDEEWVDPAKAGAPPTGITPPSARRRKA